MNKLTTDQRVRVLAALVEGNSIRATVRMTGIAKNTIVKLLADVGHACDVYQHRTLRDLPCKRIQADEIWSFCYSKAKNVPEEKRGTYGFGDVWTWTAICADIKIVCSWLLSADRDMGSGTAFMNDLASRLRYRVQVTTDGLDSYTLAVPDAFGGEVDFAQLVKRYGTDHKSPETRYSPAVCKGITKVVREGAPDEKHISTSFVERQNLTMRMSMRRFTRLTNGFSKKIDNHAAAIALHFMNYNFCRVHQSLRVTPAMAAGVADHVWTLAEVVGLLAAPALALVENSN
jgi:IS1 family transposase